MLKLIPIVYQNKLFFTKNNGKCCCINEESYGNENKTRFIEQSVLITGWRPVSLMILLF